MIKDNHRFCQAVIYPCWDKLSKTHPGSRRERGTTPIYL